MIACIATAQKRLGLLQYNRIWSSRPRVATFVTAVAILHASTYYSAEFTNDFDIVVFRSLRLHMLPLNRQSTLLAHWRSLCIVIFLGSLAGLAWLGTLRVELTVGNPASIAGQQLIIADAVAGCGIDDRAGTRMTEYSFAHSIRTYISNWSSWCGSHALNVPLTINTGGSTRLWFVVFPPPMNRYIDVTIKVTITKTNNDKKYIGTGIRNQLNGRHWRGVLWIEPASN